MGAINLVSLRSPQLLVRALVCIGSSKTCSDCMMRYAPGLKPGGISSSGSFVLPSLHNRQEPLCTYATCRVRFPAQPPSVGEEVSNISKALHLQ